MFKSYCWLVLLLLLGASSYAQKSTEQAVLLKTITASPAAAIEYVSYDKQGMYIAAATVTGDILLCNATDGTIVQQLKGHTKLINHLSFSKSGNLIASASDDGTIKVWSVKTGALIQSLETAASHALFREAYFVLFSPDEKYLYFGGRTKKLCQVPISGNADFTVLYKSDYDLTSAVYSPEKRFLVFASGYEIYFYDLKTNEIAQSIEADKNFVNDLSFNHKGNNLAVWLENGNVKFWDYPSLKFNRTLKAGNKDYSHVAFSYDDKYLATGNDAQAFNLWDMNSYTLKERVSAHAKRVRAFSFHPFEAQLATGSYDGTVKIWKLETPPPPPPKVETPPPPPKTTMPTVINDRKVVAQRTITVNTDQLNVEIWDDGKQIDGDVASLYFNNECILKEYKLLKRKKRLTIKLKPNTLNSLVLHADDLGKAPPNTAALYLLNGDKVIKKIKLSSNMTESAGINILYEPK